MTIGFQPRTLLAYIALLATGSTDVQPTAPTLGVTASAQRSSQRSTPGAQPGILESTYYGRWVTELSGGRRMVRFMWLRKTTRTLADGRVETLITPLAGVRNGRPAPARTGGGSVKVATHASGGGGGGGGASFGGGSGDGGGGGGGGGAAGPSAAGQPETTGPSRSPQAGQAATPAAGTGATQTTTGKANPGTPKPGQPAALNQTEPIASLVPTGGVHTASGVASTAGTGSTGNTGSTAGTGGTSGTATTTGGPVSTGGGAGGGAGGGVTGGVTGGGSGGGAGGGSVPGGGGVGTTTPGTPAAPGAPSSGVNTFGPKSPGATPDPASPPPSPPPGAGSTNSGTPTPPFGGSVPMSIHVDGRDAPLVVVPQGLFNGEWSANLTQIEIGGAGNQLRGRKIYPTGSLAEFDMAGYLVALDGAVRLHVPENATGFAALDYEDGLLPWAERTRAIYKEGMTDAEYERVVHRFFIESLRTAKAARPEVKWSFYGYPHAWERAELSERIRDIYAEADAITPSLYIRDSGDPQKIRAHADRLGAKTAAVRNIHPLGQSLPVALFVWHRYSSIDPLKAFQPVSVEDFTTVTIAAKPWADQFILWMAASTPFSASQLSEDLAENGRIRELVNATRVGN